MGQSTGLTEGVEITGLVNTRPDYDTYHDKCL